VNNWVVLYAVRFLWGTFLNSVQLGILIPLPQCEEKHFKYCTWVVQ